MPPPPTLPVPPALLARACSAIERTTGPLPLQENGIPVSRDLVAAAVEALNAEATRTLPLASRLTANGKAGIRGLDRHLAASGFAETGTADAVAGLLVRAGIAQRSSIPDRRSRRMVRGIRLQPAWTWTFASAEREYAGTAAWTALCPACRKGGLDHVEGQRLFGVPGTGYYTCAACGAKFVPEHGKYRLVAVRSRHDPLIAPILNRALTSWEWQEYAQAGTLQDRRGRCTGPDPAGSHRQPPGTGRTGPDGRFTLDCCGRTLYFTHIPLLFSRKKVRDLFSLRRDPVREILQQPAFRHLAAVTGTRYRAYLELPVGVFLHELKGRDDPFFREFLNPYGDSVFCPFRAGQAEIADRAGVYLVMLDGTVCAAGQSPDSFRATIDTVLGSVAPSSCYRDSDPGRVRINSLLCSRAGRCGLYACPLEGREEISRTAAGLAALLPPGCSGTPPVRV